LSGGGRARVPGDDSLRDGYPNSGLTRVPVRILRCVLCLLVAILAATSGFAYSGELAKADIERRFGPPLHVGDKLRDVPAWPLTSELEPEAGPVAYVFESIDLAPIPGFEGTPMNLLVAVDRKGAFIDVELLRQHEPVFLSGLGPQPLIEFLRQYSGKSLRQEITVSSPYGNARSGTGGNRVVLDGVTKATASVRIVNQSVLAAALAVARARLGFADTGRRGPAAHARDDAYETLNFEQLVERGMIARLRLSNADVEKLFAGTEAAGADEIALAKPDELFTELYIAYLNAPTIGRALLSEKTYAAMKKHIDDGQHLYWIGSAGRYAIVDDDFVPGTQPPRLALNQSGLPLELRDFGVEPVYPPGAPKLNAGRIFRIGAQAGLDPAAPAALALTVTRAQGTVLLRLTQQTASLDYQPPASLFVYPPKPLPEWLLAWQGRWPDLLLIGIALLVLSVVLARPRWISVRPQRLKRFRWTFLIFTLGYLGWHAQGQLSIVQITGAVKSLVAGQGLQSFLYDPVSLLLIAFTAITFIAWGRGTFCGWLCPFGALQEFVAAAAKALRVPRLRLPPLPARLLDRSRYVILAALVGAAAWAPAAAERLVEVEPFKTAITVGFDRTWPYTVYAIAMLLAGAFYYKFFCRFVCPLGAAMVLGGKLRRFNWLDRREECGKPCQTCRHRCEYDAIRRDGTIVYDDCFQCLDCVGIYHDPERCAPIMLYRRKGRRVEVRSLD
jgi:transcriptional regulator of nitric oxide reductase